jgi:hypothetical protein
MFEFHHPLSHYEKTAVDRKESIIRLLSIHDGFLITYRNWVA